MVSLEEREGDGRACCWSHMLVFVLHTEAKDSMNVHQRPTGPTALTTVIMKIKRHCLCLASLCFSVPPMQGPECIFNFFTYINFQNSDFFHLNTIFKKCVFNNVFFHFDSYHPFEQIVYLPLSDE